MRLLFVVLLLGLSGCTHFKTSLHNRVASDVMTGLSDSIVGYGVHQCKKVRAQCGGEGHYSEWQDEKGKLGCACNP
ncbi:hypothetical protein [Ferrimonas balearica]|uniref:hypothetical protein n=1 Tax=Ferrimonas balearica TaxID=44012 RepID=UPI001C9911D9|nr:hypothetical protein [Ferrimonas balearica]MBY5991733.1 hypothetical protein [Ferrimonas balearica]